MKYSFKQIVTALMVICVTTSCDVVNQDPAQSLPSETVLTTEQGASATLAGAYDAYQDVIEDDYVFSELAGDYSGHSGSYPSWANVDNHNLLSANAEARDLWIFYYDLVNITNNLIANVPGIEEEGFTEAAKNRIVAEAKVLRALSYHSLVRWFGHIPLITTPTTTLGEKSFVPQSPASDIYNQIITDLEEAEAVLGANGAPNATNATGYTAKALLARVHLYLENYEQAATYASEVIESGEFNLGSYTDLYGDNVGGSEAIFVTAFTTEDSNNLAFFALPNGSGGRYEYAPTSAYLNAFSDEDIRLEANIMDVNDDGTAELGKYFTVEGNDDVIIVRLAEMFLIRAEARGMQGNLAGAAEDLNKVQRRAFGNDPDTPQSYDYTVADLSSGNDLLDAVMNQRGIELAQEGHRWHDLVRTGRATSAFDIEENMTLWPIPQRDVQANPELEQNPGY